MKKRLVLIPMIMLFGLLTGMTALAAGYSKAWFQNGNNWCVMGPNNRQLQNCWFCDDAVSGNGKNVWYLLDNNGNMVSSPLVKDGTGNYYSLETRHEGVYGSLRYVNGWYDGVYISFSQSHNGTFGAITNMDAITALSAKYGVYDISYINNNNCYYSSSWLGSSGPGGYVPSTDSKTYTIKYYWKSYLYDTSSRSSRSFTVKDCSNTGFRYWIDQSTGDRYDPGDEYYFDSSRTSTSFNAVYYDDEENIRSLTYFVDGEVYATDRTASRTIQVRYAPYESSTGREFLYWEDDYGNHWEGGEYFTFSDNIERMFAVYGALY